jgi:hypothetical protein
MAWYFDQNVGNYIGSTTSEPKLSSNYTVSLWFSSDDVDPTLYHTLFSVVGDWDNYDVVSLDENEYLTIGSVRSGVAVSVTGATAVGSGVWHHMLFVCSGANKRVYLDGVDHINVNNLSATSTDTTYVRIGNLQDLHPLAGLVDCVKIWNTNPGILLSLNEIWTRGMPDPTPYHYLDPIAGSGDKVVNRGSGGATWVETGTVNLGDGPPVGYPAARRNRLLATRANLGGVYSIAKEGFLGGTLNWSTAANLKALAITDGYTPDLVNHQYLTSIPLGSRVSTSGVLVSKTQTLGKADSASVTFRSVNQKIEAVVIYEDTSSEATSRLVCYINNALKLPVHPHGRDATISWPTEIFQL